MKRLLKSAGLAAAVYLISFPLLADEKWELMRDSDGVRVFVRPVEGSSLKEYKAIISSEVPFETAVEIVKDHNHYRDWYGMCKDLYVIKKYNAQNFDMYFVVDMPAAKNRDLVINVKTNWDYQKGILEVKIKSKDSNYNRDSGLVRMPSMNGGFTTKRIGKSGTQTTYTFFADTGGSLPSWIVNHIAWKHPHETMTGILRETKKPKYTERANKIHNTNFKVPK